MENDGNDGRESGRAIFMAFGTKGDVFPIAAIAAAFASDQKNYSVTLVTHLAHQTLNEHLATRNVSYIPVSTPPVISIDQARSGSILITNHEASFSELKKKIRKEHRQKCLDAVAKVFGDGPCMAGDFILINFFALEGWHLAELFQVECIIAAPYVVPYSAPSSFEHHFRQELPLLYKYFHEARNNTVGWKDIYHWMWPLFMEEWGSWRSDCLNLSPIPFTDPVTNLPIMNLRSQSPLLL